MNHVNDELIVEIAGNDFITSGAYGVRQIFGQIAELEICSGRCLLHHGQGFDEMRIVGERDARDVIVFHSPEGLNTVVDIRRHLPFPQ